MASGEAASLTAPALGVDGAAEHDGAVADEVVDLGGRPRLGAQPASRIAAAMRSAISAVASCLLA